MKIGPKYKIARRLGAGVFEKTQTQKFALRQTQTKGKGKGGKGGGRGGPKTDFGVQLLEKQKARYTYLLSERQFSNYVLKALAKKGTNKDLLYGALESRIDNIVLKAGFAPTRSAARQLVSHGHIVVNGKRVNVPSYAVKVGDKLSIREASQKKPVFADLEERLKKYQAPSWLKIEPEKKTIEVQGAPKLNQEELLFDIGQVLEFYSR
ncbi:30S ribosomal protein S4 [Candidatus Parcubacteria bacterium]|nr:30S ribosomal protein S4 [Candidatus Parcubacteria bacterium]